MLATNSCMFWWCTFSMWNLKISFDDMCFTFCAFYDNQIFGEYIVVVPNMYVSKILRMFPWRSLFYILRIQGWSYYQNNLCCALYMHIFLVNLKNVSLQTFVLHFEHLRLILFCTFNIIYRIPILCVWSVHTDW